MLNSSGHSNGSINKAATPDADPTELVDFKERLRLIELKMDK